MKHMPRERASPINEFGSDKIIKANITKKYYQKIVFQVENQTRAHKLLNGGYTPYSLFYKIGLHPFGRRL